MAKRKRKPPNYRFPRVVMHMPPALLAVINSEAAKNGRTRTSEIVRRLIASYTADGLLPTP